MTKEEISNKTRFWEYVDKKKPSECWEWLGYKKPGGYGQFHRYGFGRHKPIGAHRFSYELKFGPIPKGLLICHTCDNRYCVNPKHLWLGTHADNFRDMKNKMRHCYGERNALAKLTSKKVKEIRFKYENTNTTQQKLANEYGIERGSIGKILRNERWKIT